jgi:hypothetical protein
MLAGTFDDYKGCCMIDMASKLADAAKTRWRRCNRRAAPPGATHHAAAS